MRDNHGITYNFAVIMYLLGYLIIIKEGGPLSWLRVLEVRPLLIRQPVTSFWFMLTSPRGELVMRLFGQ